MGLYDMFSGKCPFCSADYCGQSKFFECEMLTFTPETPVSAYVDDMRLEMKDKCIACDKHPVAVIKEGVFAGFEKDKPTNREGCFGASLLPEQDRKNAYWDELGIEEPKKQE